MSQTLRRVLLCCTLILGISAQDMGPPPLASAPDDYLDGALQYMFVEDVARDLHYRYLKSLGVPPVDYICAFRQRAAGDKMVRLIQLVSWAAPTSGPGIDRLLDPWLASLAASATAPLTGVGKRNPPPAGTRSVLLVRVHARTPLAWTREILRLLEPDKQVCHVEYDASALDTFVGMATARRKHPRLSTALRDAWLTQMQQPADVPRLLTAQAPAPALTPERVLTWDPTGLEPWPKILGTATSTYLHTAIGLISFARPAPVSGSPLLGLTLQQGPISQGQLTVLWSSVLLERPCGLLAHLALDGQRVLSVFGRDEGLHLLVGTGSATTALKVPLKQPLKRDESRLALSINFSASRRSCEIIYNDQPPVQVILPAQTLKQLSSGGTLSFDIVDEPLRSHGCLRWLRYAPELSSAARIQQLHRELIAGLPKYLLSAQSFDYPRSVMGELFRGRRQARPAPQEP